MWSAGARCGDELGGKYQPKIGLSTKLELFLCRDRWFPSNRLYINLETRTFSDHDCLLLLNTQHYWLLLSMAHQYRLITINNRLYWLLLITNHHYLKNDLYFSKILFEQQQLTVILFFQSDFELQKIIIKNHHLTKWFSGWGFWLMMILN